MSFDESFSVVYFNSLVSYESHSAYDLIFTIFSNILQFIVLFYQIFHQIDQTWIGLFLSKKYFLTNGGGGMALVVVLVDVVMSSLYPDRVFVEI